jgi:hypothetical protein
VSRCGRSSKMWCGSCMRIGEIGVETPTRPVTNPATPPDGRTLLKAASVVLGPQEPGFGHDPELSKSTKRSGCACGSVARDPKGHHRSTAGVPLRNGERIKTVGGRLITCSHIGTVGDGKPQISLT